MLETTFEPVGPRVLLKICEIYKDKKFDDTAIIMPSAVQDQEENSQTQGEIVAIGSLAWHDYPGDFWAKVGDTVKFVRYAGQRYEENGYLWCILNDEDITAKKKEIVNE